MKTFTRLATRLVARLVAGVAALLITLVTFQSIAYYALPQAPAPQLASAGR